MTKFNVDRRLPSALRRRPLPQAGQSLAHQFYSRLTDMLLWCFVPILLGVSAAQAWLPYWFGPRDFRAPATTYFAIGTAICGWRAVRIWRELRPLALGLKGERLVGEALEGLRAEGYRVLHDIEQPEGFNIDHVLVGPAGVFSIETKAASHPREGQGEIIYDGTSVLVNGRAPERDPVAQAAAHARRVSEILLSMTGQKVRVRPVVIYAGRFVNYQGRPAKSHPVWVMAENYFLKVLDGESKVLQKEDVALFADRLGQEARGRA